MVLLFGTQTEMKTTTEHRKMTSMVSRIPPQTVLHLVLAKSSQKANLKQFASVIR
jgi:hypothetical protein